MTIDSTPAVEYVATDALHFQYPGAGDKKPPKGAMVSILTKGDVCIKGHWIDGAGYKGWAPLPKRDKEKEAIIARNGS